MSFIITVYPEKWQYALRSGGRRALDSQQIAWCKIRHCACSGTMRSFREEGRNILIQKRKGKKNPCICSPLLHAFALLCFQRMQELGLTYLHLKWVVSVWVFYQNTRETSRVHQTTWEHSYVFFSYSVIVLWFHNNSHSKNLLHTRSALKEPLGLH